MTNMGFTEILSVILVGLAAGFLGGLLGIGGGILMVPAFLFLLKDRIPDMHVAVGTSLAVIIATAIAGTIVHHRGGRVNWQVVPFVAIFAIIGSYLGARVAGHVPGLMLRRIFAILLVVVAVKMFFSQPKPAPVAAASSESAGESGVAPALAERDSPRPDQ